MVRNDAHYPSCSSKVLISAFFLVRVSASSDLSVAFLYCSSWYTQSHRLVHIYKVTNWYTQGH